MDRKFQIFISSTYQDLIEERRAIIGSILDLGHIPVGMEAFQASNEEQWSYIKKCIDEADFYVVIVAERYGSTAAGGVSYTEMEYDYARSKDIPVAAFLLHESSRTEWRREKADSIDNRAKVEEFRQKCQSLMVQFWNNKDDLAATCVKSLSRMFHTFPREGWVPAKSALQPEVVNELARLSKENDELKRRCHELERAGKAEGEKEAILEALSLYSLIGLVAGVIERVKRKWSVDVRLSSEFYVDRGMVELFAVIGTHALSGCLFKTIESEIWDYIPPLEGGEDLYFDGDYLPANHVMKELVCSDIVDVLSSISLIEISINTITNLGVEKVQKRFHVTNIGKRILWELRRNHPEYFPAVLGKY